MAFVDSYNIPKRMSRQQLEWWILFTICVAGKGARQTQDKMKALMKRLKQIFGAGTPFFLVREAIAHKILDDLLREYKFGKYNLVNRGFAQAIEIDVKKISIENLEKIHGIGPKSARMIMLYYDPKSEAVPLDTHVLKYLRKKGYDAPKTTPSAGPKYNFLEEAFVREAKRQHKTVRELDTEVWQSYARQ